MFNVYYLHTLCDMLTRHDQTREQMTVDSPSVVLTRRNPTIKGLSHILHFYCQRSPYTGLRRAGGGGVVIMIIIIIVLLLFVVFNSCKVSCPMTFHVRVLVLEREKIVLSLLLLLLRNFELQRESLVTR